VIAPWGMPYLWKPVTYEIGVDEVKPKVRCKSCASLLPILIWLKKEFGDVEIHTSIIILDSVIDWQKQGYYKEGKDKERNQCRECFERFGDILTKVANASSYAELKQHVTDFTKSFVQCVADEIACSVDGEERKCSETLSNELKNLQIVVAPAIGRPGGTWFFIGRIQDYEIAVLREMSSRLLSTPYTRIIVDLTHGLNFMPSITTRIVPRIASILLLAHKDVSSSSVEVWLYNSDPIPPSVTESTTININEAAYTNVKSIELVHSIASKFAYAWDRKYNHIEEELNKTMSDKARKALRILRPLYSALYYPMPLALYTLACTKCKDLDALSSVEECVFSAIEIHRDKHEIVIPLTIDSDTYYVYLSLKALCKRISPLCEEVGKEASPSIDIEALENGIAPIYALIHVSYRELIMHELSNIKRGYKALMQKCQRLQGSYTSLAELEAIRIEKEKKEEKKEERMDKRIMIAHAGLQKQFVEVLIDIKPRFRYKLSIEELEKKLDEANLLIEFIQVKKH